MTYQSQTTTSLPTFLGVQLDTRLLGARVQPRPLDQRFVRVGARYAVRGRWPRAWSDALKVNAGSRLALNRYAALFASFDGEFANGGHSYAGRGGIRFSCAPAVRSSARGASLGPSIMTTRLQGRYITLTGKPASGSARALPVSAELNPRGSRQGQHSSPGPMQFAVAPVGGTCRLIQFPKKMRAYLPCEWHWARCGGSPPVLSYSARG